MSSGDEYDLTVAELSDVIAALQQLSAEELMAGGMHVEDAGDDVDAAIARYGSRVAHVQIADAPGRGEPGSGDLPLERWLAALEDAGYDGWVGLEYKPTTTTTEETSRA